jgi:hypothetical protein
MNDMTVGMENLPNVFIDKIMVERNSIDQQTVQYYTKVMLKMFDNKDNPSWRNKLDGLKVKCSFIDDERIESLNTGDLSLYDITRKDSNTTMTDSCDEFQNSNTQNGYESFTKTFEFTTLTQPENLTVYVACFIDGLEFGIPQFDKFYGPMAAERIFVGGIPNQESGYFYNPETNEEYGGPVHQHSSGYMEGSEHIDAAHAGLRYVSEENYKMIVGTYLTNQVFDGIDTGMIFDFGDGTPSLDNLGANAVLTSDDESVELDTTGISTELY